MYAGILAPRLYSIYVARAYFVFINKNIIYYTWSVSNFLKRNAKNVIILYNLLCIIVVARASDGLQLIIIIKKKKNEQKYHI